MNLNVNESISIVTVFLQGLANFFSPCVLPLLPIYISYLSGGTVKTSDDGTQRFDRKKVLVNTIFFVIGIAFAFLVLGLGLRAVGRFFGGNQLLFARIGGIVVVLFGLYQLGLFGDSMMLARERRLPVNLSHMAMSPVTALVMGFVFSFAWTPCVGPTLSGVLLMAASAKTSAKGFVLIGVYTAGFIIPFILTGIFTTSLLSAFRKHRQVVRYSVKIGGVLLLVMGIMMLTGTMNNVTGYFSALSGQETAQEYTNGKIQGNIQANNQDGDQGSAQDAAQNSSQGNAQIDVQNSGQVDVRDNDQGGDQGSTQDASEGDGQGSTQGIGQEKNEMKDGDAETEASAGESGSSGLSDSAEASDAEAGDSNRAEVFPAPDFTLKDQYGEEHSLSEYRGKIVFLNFWATWCPPCRAEMPDIQQLYEENQADEDSDLVILAVAFPGYGDEKDEGGIRDFLDENGYTYPTLMDEGATLAAQYYISAFPTTFMIDKEGNIFGYVPGSMSKDIMESIIQQTREAG